MRKARVFISCGQRTAREKNIGLEIDRFFRDRGFETYFAEKVHSPEALTDHIFKFLRESEYFVFIDFKRDKISEEDFRGSLFVSQEIGISTFLKIPGLGFYERGVKREGILTFQIYNAFLFDDGTEIINRLQEETRDWDHNSVNELFLSYNPQNDSKDVTLNNHPQKALTDWWHVEVKNRNKNKHAFTCLSYLTKIINIESDEIIEIPSIELIWSGLGDFTVNIMANGRRELDAFFIIHNENRIRFQSRMITTTSPRFNLPTSANGRYLLEYSIVSANFGVASREFILNHTSSHKGIEFIPK
ncbi:MAG: hypothetical protein WC443_00175 [Desulfobaccales bacterium]